ncbi:hypothetical protein B0H15DRAFT_950057 [Mycena belliarum]|uniref:F-box domain-containing protein n=1 Tax=Mycena belliarum TaxID=1033014 RepID=A0AAD6U423_9AGAR|nr:hypothetical protein B0H15DRAFT_950057 [Mycena belliae]
MASLQLLDLPPELIVSCLIHLPRADLVSCFKAQNHFLCRIILDSILVQYRLEQDRASVEENPVRMAGVAISDRLADLRRREEDWLAFNPRSRHTIKTSTSASMDFYAPSIGSHDVGADIYATAEGSHLTPQSSTVYTAIQYMYTSPEVDSQRWHTLEFEKPFLVFFMALDEDDLIVIARLTPQGNNVSVLDMSVDVSLYKFPTGHLHPLAAQPILHIHTVQMQTGAGPVVSVDRAGDSLAVSILYQGDAHPDMDTLHVYDWKTGHPKMAPRKVNGAGLAFLTMDTLVVPNAVDASLDILRIPESSPRLLPARLVHSLGLPALAPGHEFLSCQCFARPNIRAGSPNASRAKFVPTLDNSLLLCWCWILLPEGGDRDTATYPFVIDRARLQHVLGSTPDGVRIPWAVWGPRCTRWFPATLPLPGMGAVYGARLVLLAPCTVWRPSPLRILDFNPLHVGAARRRTHPPHVRVVEADDADDAIDLPGFVEPLLSLLPYVETTSQERFVYPVVLINNDNIIGYIRSDEEMGEEMDKLEVLHFG